MDSSDNKEISLPLLSNTLRIDSFTKGSKKYLSSLASSNVLIRSCKPKESKGDTKKGFHSKSLSTVESKRQELNKKNEGNNKPRVIKQGWLEKSSKSLLKSWKEKYCKVIDMQFVFYKNVSTGWMSGHIDFRKVTAKVSYDKSSTIFTYIY